MNNPLFRLPLLAAGLLLVAAPSFAAESAGPEPYRAADPVYAPMTKEPLVKEATTTEKASLGSAEGIKGPAAGPEPYSAADPVYTPMSKEPEYQPPAKTPAPKL